MNGALLAHSPARAARSSGHAMAHPSRATASHTFRSGVMSSLKHTLTRFAREESGATMVEYGIMVALIAALAIAVIKVVGQKVNNGFQAVNANMP